MTANLSLFSRGFALCSLVLAFALTTRSNALDDASGVRALPIPPPTWARNDPDFSVEQLDVDGRACARIQHHTATDWSASIPGRIDVKPGEVYRLRWETRNAGPSAAEPGVVLYDARGEALDWSYGGREIFKSDEWETGEKMFVVPRGVAQIEARIIGAGKTDFYVASYEIALDSHLELVDSEREYELENACLKVTARAKDGTFSVEDKRTGRVWRQTDAYGAQFVTRAVKREDVVAFNILDGQTFLKYSAALQLDVDKPELIVTLSAPAEAEQRDAISYPRPFATRTTDRVIFPVNEGISFPATDETPRVGRVHTFGGHGLCMSFWGVATDALDPAKSDGYMGLIETPDDSEIDLRALESDDDAAVKTTTIGTNWHGALRKFGYDRKLRLVFFDKGGYVAQCKRYREFAKSIGRLVTFEEKSKKSAKLAEGLSKLLGAANIWSWDGNRETFEKIRALGMNRILWSGGGSAEELDEMNKIDSVLTSRYDIYQDIMDPARYDDVAHVHSDWIPEAWPQDLLWDSPDGHWARGWEVDQKDRSKPRVPCGVLCDSKAVDYARRRIGAELEKKDYRARFLDTTVASPWRECWNPDHPMTRTQCKEARMALLDLIHEFGLVCGSETGIDASVPFCDFYEGMMSLGPYRCPESGRYLTKIWDEVPEVVEKYQLGEKYRLPLFELVYHDCVVSYWYWGDHNNKFPALWKKRDLFNALYAVPPMYGFTRDFLKANEERFKESYAIATQTALLANFTEMTNHEILTEDRSVQKTTFANGLEVVVNFGDKEFAYESNGARKVVPARSSVVAATPRKTN